MTDAVGCHGGKHRSVAMSEALAARLGTEDGLAVGSSTAMWVANDGRIDHHRLPGARIVAFGGGHGLYATLSAARRLSSDVTAVVTVADDGGSSGRLRNELGMIRRRLRMALAALAAQTPDVRSWTETVQHRFGGSGALGATPSATSSSRG